MGYPYIYVGAKPAGYLSLSLSLSLWATYLYMGAEQAGALGLAVEQATQQRGAAPGDACPEGLRAVSCAQVLGGQLRLHPLASPHTSSRRRHSSQRLVGQLEYALHVYSYACGDRRACTYAQVLIGQLAAAEAAEGKEAVSGRRKEAEQEAKEEKRAERRRQIDTVAVGFRANGTCRCPRLRVHLVGACFGWVTFANRTLVYTAVFERKVVGTCATAEGVVSSTAVLTR